MNKPLDDEERLLVQRLIASRIDYPSVYMCGPSANSMRVAASIIKTLEQGQRLVSTRCGHSGWQSYKQHGIYCPDCDLKILDDNYDPKKETEALDWFHDEWTRVPMGFGDFIDRQWESLKARADEKFGKGMGNRAATLWQERARKRISGEQ